MIEGVRDQTVYAGDTISYKKGVKISDNRDGAELEIDNSEVDLDVPGTYKVVYTVVDKAGNKTSKEASITVAEPPKGYENKSKMEELAGQVVSEIIEDGMTKKEMAKAIYTWCVQNINYVNDSDKDSWINGAVQGLTEHSGDCFVYFATAKALLTQVKIDNIDVVKSDTSHSSHYWSLVNVGEGWYHFDTTPRQGKGDYFFLVTDAELEKYSKAHDNSHIFDHSLYPATPEE